MTDLSDEDERAVQLMVGRIVGKDLKLEIYDGPRCPHCREDGFDDWWHAKTVRLHGSLLTGSLKCHGCGKFFSVTRYADGKTHSTAWQKQRADKGPDPCPST